ncbi:MAG: TolC family protein [Candidatus Cryptobacteroides sp.]
MTIKTQISALIAALMLPAGAMGQQVLTLEQCREMAISNNKTLEQSRTQVEMAGYDRKIARANYYPNISATGAYMYNEKNIALISEQMSDKLTNAGTLAQGAMTEFLGGLQQAIASNPAAAQEFMQSPLWQTVMGALQQTDISGALNQLGSEIDDAFHLDAHNIFAAGVSLQQPVFMGGKIVAANRIALLAEDLAKARYEKEYQDLVTTVDQAYWQIVSIAAKKRLAEDYSDLLKKMERDVKLSAGAGLATKSDELSIKVKANEADMMKTKATNGLVLAKMLLCKEIGLDLNSEIVLADESLGAVPVPEMAEARSLDDILADRPETRSLDLATRIYDQKIRVARADMMPKVALTANYLVSNPNAYNGFQNKWGGMFNVGVAVNIPIFHGMEATQKTRKAKAEATLYRSQYEDACNMINLQVTQLHKQQEEALEKLAMAESNLKSAEENLRTATVGFENGVVTSNTALAAHTAWLQAHSEIIDAGIELQMVSVNLNKAEARYKSDIE